jgi:hypothetical protein
MTIERTVDGRVPLTVGLVRARTHIVFIAGLLTAGGIIIATDRATEHVGAQRPTSPTAAEREAATWAWAAASRSASPADVARARLLARAMGVRPDAGAAAGALSPSGGLAALEDLYAARRPTPATAPPSSSAPSAP